MRRTLQKELEDPLSCMLLSRDWPAGTVFTAGCRGEGVKLSGKIPEGDSADRKTEAAEGEAVERFELAGKGF